MKNLVLAGALLISTTLFCQHIDVPEPVLKSFEEMYFEVDDVKWKKLKGNYQATFEDVDVTMALFSPEGKWLKTAIIITEDDLPAAAADHVTDNYDDAIIKQVQMIENNKEEVSYLVILISGDEKIKVKFDSEGDLIL